MFTDKNKQPRNSKTKIGRSPVNTYYRAANNDETPSPFTKKTPKKSAKKFLLGFVDVVLIFILIFILIYSLIVKPNPKVEVNDTSFHTVTAYQTAVQHQLRQLKYRNKISFSENSLASALQKQYPEISAVAVELPLFSQQPKVKLSIAKPSFQINSKGVNYVINSDGVAVAQSSKLPGVKNLITINDQTGFPTNEGTKVLSGDSVSFIETVLSQAKRAKVPISSLEFPSSAPQELNLRTADQPYYVKFYLGGDALTQTGQFLAARQSFNQKHLQPAEYLDVRVGGKIFYK